MLKKFAVLLLIAVVAYIALPCGYAYWNENLGVEGQISFAEPSEAELTKAAPEDVSAGSEASSSINPSVVSGETLVSGQNLAGESSAPELKQSEASGVDSGMLSTSASDTDPSSSAPPVTTPVEASDNPSSLTATASG